MGAKPGQKMLTVWVDAEERDALQTLCKTNGISVSAFLRSVVIKAVEEQTTAFIPAAHSDETSPSEMTEREKALTHGWQKDSERIRHLEKRLASLEKAMPKFNEDDLVEMREEILSGESGSVRYRLGIVEAQLQSLGGSIAWKSTPAAD